jgi:hypothetical protein
LRCTQLIAGVLGRAGEAGQKKRLEAAKTGKVTWQPPPGLGKPMTEEDRRKEAEAKKAAMKAKELEAEKDQNSQIRGPGLGPLRRRIDPDDPENDL